MLELGPPEYVRIAYPGIRVGLNAPAPPIHATSVDAPFRARENIRNAVTRSRMLPSVRPLARPSTAGLHGSSRSGSRSRWRTRSTVLHTGFPDPVSPTVAPCPPSARPTPRWPRRAYAAMAGALYVPPLTSRAQTTRAILLARATVTSIRGLRASIRASHEPFAAPRWLAQRTTALAPRMSRRRMVRSPIFEMAPSFRLPPVDRCSGVSPSQAAKSRPV